MWGIDKKRKSEQESRDNSYIAGGELLMQRKRNLCTEFNTFFFFFWFLLHKFYLNNSLKKL